MMFNKFHEEDFQGVVLKISEGIIATNPEMKKVIRDLKEKLDNLQFSVFEPNHRMNLYELSNFKDKRKIKQGKNELAEDRRKKEMKRIEDLVNLRVIPLVTSRMKTSSYLDRIILGEEILKDIYVRSGLKSSVVKKTNQFLSICSKKQFKTFLRDNNFYIMDMEEYPHFNISSCYLTIDSQGNPCLNYYLESIKIHIRGKRDKNKIYNRDLILDFDSDEKYYFSSGIKIDGLKTRKDKNGNVRFSLEEYERINGRFIKL